MAGPIRGIWRGGVMQVKVRSGGCVVHIPGHVPFDTTTALWEGRTHMRMNWGPPMFSAILGLCQSEPSQPATGN